MKNFKVCFNYAEKGTVVVKANTAFEAEAKVENELKLHGTKDIDVVKAERTADITCAQSLSDKLFEE